MNSSVRHVKPILHVLVLTLTILLNHPLVARVCAQGDVLILLDQSNSMHLYNPGFSINAWLVDFYKTVPESGDVVLVGFDERVHAPITITPQEVKSTELLQAKLETVKLAGRVTDFEQPLQYLLNYKGDIAMAVLITDGEPDIWDSHLHFLSRSVLNDARYGALNDRYKAMASQGVSQEERYRKLSGLYGQKNIGFIEERLADIRSKLGSRLIFIDVYGKFNFLTRWADLASARLVVAQAPSAALHELSEQKIITRESKDETLAATVTLETKPMENKPAEDIANHAGQSQGQAGLAVQPVKVVSLPPLTVTLENAKDVVPGMTATVYKTEAWSIILAVGLAVLVMALLWATREFSLKQRKAARNREVELEQRELQRITEENTRLEQVQSEWQAKIVEARSALVCVQDEKSGCEKELDDLKKSVDQTVAEYRRQKFAEADREVADKNTELERLLQERKREIEKECEAFKAEKLAAYEGELEAEKAIQAEVLRHNIAAEFKSEEDAYALKMQARKEQVLEELTNWKIAETARKQQELAAELAITEAESQEKIEQWEQDATARVQGLLESRYLEQKETYKNDLRLLAEQREAAAKNLEALSLEIETQQEGFERRRHEIAQEIEAQERRMQATFKNREALLWEETVAETKQAKEEAMARVRKWEKDEKDRLLGMLQA